MLAASGYRLSLAAAYYYLLAAVYYLSPVTSYHLPSTETEGRLPAEMNRLLL